MSNYRGTDPVNTVIKEHNHLRQSIVINICLPVMYFIVSRLTKITIKRPEEKRASYCVKT